MTASILARAQSSLSRSHIAGLTLSTPGSSTNFSVAVGVAMDSTNVRMMSLASVLTKTTAVWVVGNNQGALDTGAIANSTWYHVFLIENPTTGVVDVLISLSATAPTLPSGYTLFRRIGSMKTDGSGNWVAFSQNGDEFLWLTPVADVATNSLGTTATLFMLSVPIGVKVSARFRGVANNAAGSVLFLINSPDETSSAAYTPAGNMNAETEVANVAFPFDMSIRTNASGQIRAVASAASSTLDIATYGWTDRRGRDN